MRCPYCKKPSSKVIESRSIKSGDIIRRRRECVSCSHRFTTYERLEEIPIMVVKRDGRREEFSIEKLRSGVLVSLRKRPVSSERAEELIGDVIAHLFALGEREIPSEKIGELVMEGLRLIDHVAYIRFASVYRRFEDADAFAKELKNLTKKGRR
jgi:transcriptional repressor NrdR